MNLLELKKFREKYNISRESLAEMIGVSINTLNNWEYRFQKLPKNKIKHIEYIVSTYGNDVQKNIKTTFFNKEGAEVSETEIAEYVVDNWEDIMKDRLFAATFKAEAGAYFIRLKDANK